MPCMGPLTAADELLGPKELWCCACGRKSAATPEQVAQAKRADAAWAVEQDRIMRRPGMTDAHDGYQQMPDRVHDRESPDLEARCQECGEAGARACSYKCGAVLCKDCGAEHHPPDCPPQMEEYIEDAAGHVEAIGQQQVAEDRLTLAKMREAVAVLERDSIKPDADGVLRWPILGAKP